MFTVKNGRNIISRKKKIEKKMLSKHLPFSWIASAPYNKAMSNPGKGHYLSVNFTWGWNTHNVISWHQNFIAICNIFFLFYFFFYFFSKLRKLQHIWLQWIISNLKILHFQHLIIADRVSIQKGTSFTF